MAKYNFRVVTGYYCQLDSDNELNFALKEDGSTGQYYPTGVYDAEYQEYRNYIFIECNDRFNNPPKSKRKFKGKYLKIQPFKLGEILIIDADTCIEVGYNGRKTWKHCCSWEDFASIKKAEKRSWEVCDPDYIPAINFSLGLFKWNLTKSMKDILSKFSNRCRIT